MRRLDRWALLLGALGLLLALPMITYPLGRDQGMYANIAQAIRAGGLPFIDMWDIKPPAIYYIYALQISLFGATPVALRALDIWFAPLTMLALFQITDAFAGRRAARWAMLLFPVFYFTETFASLTQSDSLVLLPMTWAVLCALRAGQAPTNSRRAVLWSFACGFLCAVVILFKHYYTLFALVLAVSHLTGRLQPTGQRFASLLPLRYEIGAFVAGGLLFGIPVLAYFSTTGILNEMLIVAQGTSQYNMDALRSLSAFWEQMDSYVEYRWWHWGPLLVLALSSVVLAVVARKPVAQADAASRMPSTLLWLWFASGIIFVVIQAKGFDTHWLPLLPPLVLVASRVLDGWITHLTGEPASTDSTGQPRMAVAGRWLLVASVVVLFSAILAKDTWLRAWPHLTGQQTQRAYLRQFQAGDLNARDSLRMAEWLEAHTNTGDSVYIWGFRPEIAFMAGLRPATRFQAQFALVGDRYPQAWKQENVDTLWAAMPPYVIVVRADNMPWVTGMDKDSNTMLAQDYKALEDWLIANYDRDVELGNFLIWTRKERT